MRDVPAVDSKTPGAGSYTSEGLIKCEEPRTNSKELKET